MSQTYLMQANARSTSLDLQRVEAENAQLRARIAEMEAAICWYHAYKVDGAPEFPDDRVTYPWRGVAWKHFACVRDAIEKRLGIEREGDQNEQFMDEGDGTTEGDR